MQKRSLTIIVIALLCALVTAFALVGCGKVDFKLNFVVDGEVYDTISTNGKEAIKLPDNPKKDGYIFDGWYWDNEVWKKPFTANSLLDTPLSSDMSVYAKFEKEEAVKGTQAEFVGFEKVSENKYFKKVSNDTEIFSLGTLVKVNSKSSWIASYDVSCTKVILSKIVELTAGDNFCYVNVTDENGNMSLYTLNIRRREIYEVSFADSDVQSQYIEEDSCAVTPSTANRTGYTFESWNFDFSTPIVKNTVISAKWNLITYNIEYELNGGENNSLNPTTYNIECEDIVLQMPNKTGYDFVGWYADEAVTEKAEKIAIGSYGNKKFYTKWNITTYNIEYELNGGKNNSLNPTTYTIESNDIVLQSPSKTGYDFAGWYADEALSKKAGKIVAGSFGTKKFYAKWNVVTYNIEYELNGGVNNSANPTTYTIESEDIVLRTPTIQSEDYDGFIGWFSDKELRYEAQSIKQGSCGNKTFYAKWSSKYFLFDTHSKTITGLTDYGKTCSKIVIPEKLYNITVASIGGSAFYDCKGLTSVTIPDSVMSIGSWAFSGCTNLTSVYYEGDIASWCGVSGLENIMSGSQTLYIGGNKVEGELVVPNSVKSISDAAFYGCKGLTSVTIPDSVTSIGVSAFSDCKDLTSVIIPDSVTSISDGAFRNCTGLTSVTIPDSVTSIDSSAFRDCTGLTSVTIPDSVTSIGDLAFYSCTGLTSVTIPNSVTNINAYAFYLCIGLKKIYYKGTESQWDTIIKDAYWDDGAGNYTIIYNA